MICFHFSIFEPLETTGKCMECRKQKLWFAFILVSLNHWKQLGSVQTGYFAVVICFHFSIFEPLETTIWQGSTGTSKLWFAFILVSLNHWKQLNVDGAMLCLVVICFHFSIFEPLESKHSIFRLDTHVP